MSQSGSERQTVIDEGTGFKGDFESACPIVVKGRIEGKLSAPSLTVDPTGAVCGTVKVKELRSEGELSGEFEAEYVKLSGSVKDNTVIRAKILEVQLSPEPGKLEVTFGQCELEVGDLPDKAAAIENARRTGATVPPPSEAAEAHASRDADAPKSEGSDGAQTAAAEGTDGEGRSVSRNDAPAEAADAGSETVNADDANGETAKAEGDEANGETAEAASRDGADNAEAQASDDGDAGESDAGESDAGESDAGDDADDAAHGDKRREHGRRGRHGKRRHGDNRAR